MGINEDRLMAMAIAGRAGCGPFFQSYYLRAAIFRTTESEIARFSKENKKKIKDMIEDKFVDFRTNDLLDLSPCGDNTGTSYHMCACVLILMARM